MKGVVLAGGLGTRLYPLTKVTNKHLLPVYNKPMVYYPIEALARAGLQEVLLVTGGNNAGDFLPLLGRGEEFGLKSLEFAYQHGHGGIAAALALAEEFADGSPLVVILGDNIIEKNISTEVEAFRRQPAGCRILLKEVEHPERFGCPVFEGGQPPKGKIVRIEEKPTQPKSPFAVIGIYMYDAEVFDIIRTLRPSARGELEITDVHNLYLSRGSLTYGLLEGWWTDAGSSFEALLRANNLVAQTGANKVEE